MAKPLFLECVECGTQQPYLPLIPTICEKCQSAWVEAKYDYVAFKRELLRGLPGRPHNLFRYADVLPLETPLVQDNECAVGWTPMRLSHNYANSLGHHPLYIKDERYSPTNSFKDRQAAVSVAAMLETEVREMVIASTGNAAV